MAPESQFAPSVDQIKDEVYRQMLRLEAGHISAPGLLGAALLQAWMLLEQEAPGSEERQWLRKLSPLCMRLIREASGALTWRGRCAQK
jgi:hypothetical protein